MGKQTITLGTGSAHPGSKGTGFFTVAEYSSGMEVKVPVMIVNGSDDGPTIWVQACIHGDEISGCYAVREVFKRLSPEAVRGAFIGIPALNAVAFQNYERSIDPSGFQYNVDLNLSFPGSADGDYMQQVADKLHREILAKADYMIDLHSGGIRVMIWPGWTLFYDDGSENGRESRRLAEAFGFEEMVGGTFQDVGISRFHNMPFVVATKAGVPSIIAECGGGSELKEEVIETIVGGIMGTLSDLKVIEGASLRMPEYRVYRNLRSVKAKRGGLFRSLVSRGEAVEEGQIIASIVNFFGDSLEEVTAPKDASVLAIRLYPPVNTGTLLFHLGETP